MGAKQSATGINFPVLRYMQISGYELFPGKGGEGGLKHSFKPGITVISGVNGLGKTTLLNIILRMLIGPAAAKKDENQTGRSSSHETKIVKPFDLFRDRVSDEAKGALVTAVFTIGSSEVLIERSLETLDIQKFQVDGKDVGEELNNEVYQESIRKLCGLSQFYDFYFVINNMVFFLEDRVPLIWREEDQFEIFRILYSGTEDAKRLSDLHSVIKKKDSDYRNMRWHINKEEKALAKKKHNENEGDKPTQEYKAYTEAYKGLEDKYQGFEEKIIGYLKHKDRLVEKIEVQKIELEERQRTYEGFQQRYFSSVFPKISETAEYMLIHLASESGCLVCGSKDTKEFNSRLSLLSEKCICPICNSPPEKQEALNDNQKPTVSAAEFSNERLKAEYDKLKKERGDLEKLKTSLSETEQKIKELYDERGQTSEKLEKTRHHLERIKAQLPVSADSIRKQADSIKLENQKLASLRIELEEHWSEYKILLEQATNNIGTIVGKITSHFEEYAGHFLAEECKLSYRTDERKIGEEGPKFSFPSFDVLMTSGVFSKPTARKEKSDVSESQQEFIDLAFRMALMSAISSKANFMMVLETPEASLDSLFIGQAGLLLRKFAGGGSDRGNVLIASSNLNAGNMIGELLKQGDETKEKSKISERLINLLEIAAPNAALRKNKEAYLNELKKNLEIAEAA